MATVADLRAALPQFASVADATIQLYLDMAERGIPDPTVYEDSWDDAHIFLAAHLMSLAGIGPAAQAGSLAGFTNIRAGSLSLTRSERAAAGEYASSQFGILFWRLTQRFISGVGLTVTGTGSMPDGYSGGYTHGQG